MTVTVSDYRSGFFSAYHGTTTNVSFLRSVDSTNSMAGRLAKEFARDDEWPPRTLLLAVEQTDGRGRADRSWESAAGEGVYATLMLTLDDAQHLQSLPLRVAVGLARALDALTGRPCEIKWPNDLLVGGAKIGGILIETVARGDGALAILGFGINHGRVPTLVDRRATSIRDLHASAVALPAAAALLVESLEYSLTEEMPIAEYTRRSAHRLGDAMLCRVGNETVRGEFAGFDARGFLRLRAAGGERVLSAAEVIES